MLRNYLVALFFLFSPLLQRFHKGAAAADVVNPNSLLERSLKSNHPKPDPRNVVEYGELRFTILSSRLVRIECGPSGFHDKPTLVALNRNFGNTKHSSTIQEGHLFIKTERLSIKYTPTNYDNSGCSLDESQLSITSINTVPSFTYEVSSSPSPLPGAIRSLDLLGPVSFEDCSTLVDAQINGESLHCTPGLVSRNGWVMWNDTDTPRLTSGNLGNTWWDISERNERVTGYQDLYFFGHGRNYRAVLQDFVHLSGPIPLVPRYALGNWWTRWYDLDSQDVTRIVNEHRQHALPLDLFMFDMNWHKKNNWGGYTWDDNLYPSFQETLAELQEQGVKVGANLHDNNGVQDYDERYSAFAKYLGLDPKKHSEIPFLSCSNQSYAYGLEDVVLGPLNDAGVDVWWIDWQQGGDQGGCPGGKYNPTIWLNHLRGTRSQRTAGTQRDLILARWGGLGSHRYQMGFSGDVDQMDWSRLAYQPYFSSVGANVGYGMWSHDITARANDPELYVRWVQFGALSGALRMHDRGQSAGTDCRTKFPSTISDTTCAVTTPWSLSHEYFEPVRDALRGRYELTPYLYNLAREAFDTGVSIVHPVYYDYPNLDMAYASKPNGDFAQYMLGSMLVAPVVTPATAENKFLAEKKVWVPPGLWVERYSGWVIDSGSSGKVIQMNCLLDHTPTFVPAGAVMPVNRMELASHVPIVDLIGKAAVTENNYRFVVHSIGNQGMGYEYRDDGASLDYMDSRSSQAAVGSWSNTTTSFNWNKDRTVLQLTVHLEHLVPRHHFEQVQKVASSNLVNLRLDVLGMLPPTDVEFLLNDIDGSNWESIDYDRSGSPNSWHFDGTTHAVVVDVGNIPVEFSRDSSSEHGRWMVGRRTVSLTLTMLQTGLDIGVVSGAKGAIALSRKAKALLDEVRMTPGSQKPARASLMIIATLGTRIELLARQGDVIGIYNKYLSIGTLLVAAQQEVEVMRSNLEPEIGGDDEVKNRIDTVKYLLSIALSYLKVVK